MAQESINIALSTDDNYACHTAVVIASILYNANKEDNLHFFIMGNISLNTKNNICKLKKIKSFEITFLSIDESKLAFLRKVNIRQHVTLATYYKLFMPDYFPHINKILWLDSDLIVLTSLKELWEVNIDDYYFAATSDIGQWYKEKIGIPEDYIYINSGVFIMNSRKMREENALAYMVEYVEKNYSKFTVADQCIINGAFYDKIKLTEHKWNFIYEFVDANLRKDYIFRDEEDYKQAFSTPAIVHFAGNHSKPWLIGIKLPYKNEYWKYLKMTEWWMNYYKYLFAGIILQLKSKKPAQQADKLSYLHNIKKLLFLLKITYS